MACVGHMRYAGGMASDIRHLLVTGGAGFVGSNFVHWVVRNHPEVRITVLDALTYAGNLRSLDGIPADRMRFVHGDVCDADILERLIPGADAVVHFAAESNNDASIAHPRPFVRTNVEGTATLLEAAHRHNKRMHHVSTDEVFGDMALGDASCFTEDSPYRPSSPYSASKAASDMLVRAWYRTYGLPVTVSNCCNNYGPRQHVEKLIPRLITNLMTGRGAKLYGDGSNVRDWIHVDDHASALWAILTRGRIGESYLIGAEDERSNKQVAQEILQAMGRSGDDIEYVKDRPGHDRRYAIDASKLRRELGWAPECTSFSSGIVETVRWYRENPDWWEPQKEEAEAEFTARGM